MTTLTIEFEIPFKIETKVNFTLGFRIIPDLSLVHTVGTTTILLLKMPLPCEHLHLVTGYPFLMSTVDETKIIKFMSLPLQCDRAFKRTREPF